MNCCCQSNHTAPGIATSANSGGPTWFSRIGAGIQWVIPFITLALIPKCPACVAAQVLLFTGLGLTFAAATIVRWVLIAISLAMLVILVTTTMVRKGRLIARRRSSSSVAFGPYRS